MKTSIAAFCCFLLLADSATAGSMRMKKKGMAKKRMTKKGQTGKSKLAKKDCRQSDFTCPFHLGEDPSHSFGNAVAIANRAAGTISLVDPESLETVTEYLLPDDGEPMYFAISQAKSEIWVGDRANNRLVVLKMIGCELVMDGYVSTPAGLFHSMITQRGDVDYPIAATTCDIDNVIIVHDLTTRRELAVMERPQEAIDAGAKPHDVTTNGDYIFVTFLGTADGAGYVASYDTVTFELVSVLETAADPHVAIRGDTDLFIAAQGGVVYKVSVPDLTILSSTDRPSPHGMIVSFDSKYMYTTNIGEGGDMAIDNWDVGTGAKMDCPDVTTTWPTPHNPTISFNGKYLYITHSGGDSTKNSRFHIGHDGCVDPHSEYVFDTNLNPFGLFVVAPAAPLLTCRNA